MKILNTFILAIIIASLLINVICIESGNSKFETVTYKKDEGKKYISNLYLY
jgi:hypothetical protein